MIFRFSIVVLVFFLTGCASILNPYESEFSCPKTEKGKCVPIRQAYDESIRKGVEKKEVETPTNGLREQVKKEKDTSFTAYEDEMFKKMKGLLREPVTPLVAPPQVMRVLFLSYKGEGNELFMPRFVYFFVDEPKWVLSDYILGKETE